VKVVAHLSDLHFGRISAPVLSPLAKSIEEANPDLVVVSGDLTQRARPAQFREARAFLDGLPGAKLVVPGNHDVPLYDVYQRFFHPLGRYRRHFSAQTEPEYVDEEIAVIGVNTARSAVIKGGRINARQVARMRARLCRVAPHVTKIVVTHHPFDLPAPHAERHLVGRAAMAMAELARLRADLLLAGHFHASHAGDTATRYRIPGFAALVVQAGTATSTRSRGEANAFNVLRIEGGAVTVEQRVWTGSDFSVGTTARFVRGTDGWRQCQRRANV
jgi:3',5'-cyclic AMP phosphodiesterase CpdA